MRDTGSDMLGIIVGVFGSMLILLFFLAVVYVMVQQYKKKKIKCADIEITSVTKEYVIEAMLDQGKMTSNEKEGVRKQGLFASNDMINAVKNLHADSLLRVKFSPEMSKGLRNGALEYTKAKDGGGFKTIVKHVKGAKGGKGGKIAGHGNLLKKSAASRLAGGAFQIGSVVFGQAHLQDIASKLQSIEDSISDLKSEFEHERHGKIKAAIKYIQNIRDEILGGGLVPERVTSVMTNIERLYIELDGVSEEYISKINSAPKKISKIENSMKGLTTQSAEDDKNKLMEVISDTAEDAGLFLSVEATKVATLNLLRSLPVSQATISNRFKNIYDEVNKFVADVGKLKYPINSISGIFTSSKTERRYKRETEQCSEDARLRIKKNGDLVLNEINDCQLNEKMLLERIKKEGIECYAFEDEEGNMHYFPVS